MEITDGKELICIEHNDSEVHVAENEPSDRQDLTTTNHWNIEDSSVVCLSDKEDERMTESSTDNSVRDQEFVASDNVNLCAYTESEATDLIGAKPEFGNETDSVDTTMETSKELLQDSESVVIQDDQEISTFSERADNSLQHNNCDVSISISPPVEDAIVTEAKDDGHLNKYQDIHENMSEEHSQEDSSFEVSASSETSVGEDTNLETNLEAENEVKEQENSAFYIPLNLEKIENNNNEEVADNEMKDFEKYARTDFCVDAIAVHEEQCSPKTAETETVITQEEFVERAEHGNTTAEICENSHVSCEDKTAEIDEDSGGTHVGNLSTENTDSRNVDTSQMTTGLDLGSGVDTAVDSIQNETDILSKETQPAESLLDNTIVLQQIDAGTSNAKFCCL